MALASVGTVRKVRTGKLLLACVADQGSAAHDYVRSGMLLKGPHAARNLADAIHFLCMLHGRHPGVIDHASARCADPPARAWIGHAVDAFGFERAFLTRLAVAAGPMPSTAGAADAQSAVLAQRHALATLAQSERNGCALGAALSLALDWEAVRGVLEAAGRRFGVAAPPARLTDVEGIHALADSVAGSPSAERALMFGAEQVAVQHHGLWALLEARAEARGDD
jgi:hypothetical protein